MITHQALSEAIGRIYDTSLNPNAWPPVLEWLCSVLDAKAASLHEVNPIAGRISLFHEYGTNPAYTAMLMGGYAAMSPIGAAPLLAELDQPIGAFDFVDETEYVESRFYKEWCAPQGYYDMLGTLFSKRPTAVGSIAATRCLEKGKFGNEEREVMRLIAPHVRRAVTISGLIEQRTFDREMFAGAIDSLSSAIAILNRNAHVIHLNAAAEQSLKEAHVMALRDGTLALGTSDANMALGEMLASNGTTPRLIPINCPKGSGYIAGVIPLRRDGRHAVIVSRHEPDMPAVGKALALLHGLTPREVSVVMPLLDGQTIEEIAASLGIGIATAKSHLNKIFAKTGTSRQAELVQKVLRSLAPVSLKSED